MRRPIPSKSAANLTKKTQELQLLDGEAAANENVEKLKLAATLHTQGINPERWTEAQPASWAAQKAFQETGQKPDEQHFAVNGRLYKSGLHVAATQAQGQDAIDVYLGAAPKPVDQLVDITKVPLKYPFGRPHEARDARPDAHALNLHYARLGVDPGSAHNGDPLPMDQQPKLQQATRAPDGSEIPLGIPGIYRGYDDGFFYAANEGTKESTEVQALRRKLAEEKATAQGDAAAMVANDNDPEIDEAVARSYQSQAASATQEKSLEESAKLPDQGASATSRLPILISAIEKKQNGQPLSKDEESLLQAVDVTFGKAGIPIDLKKADTAHLKKIAEAEQKEQQDRPKETGKAAAENKTTMPVIAGTTMALPALGGAGELFAGARAAAATVTALLSDAAIGATAAGSAAFAGLVGGFLALMTSPTQTQEQEDAELQRVAEQVALSRPKPAEIPTIEKPDSLRGSTIPPANDNQPDPANDNDPSRGPGITAGIVASAATAGLLAGDERELENAPQIPEPKAFNPISEDLRDIQNDFAHAVLQGQSPQIWINGEEITAYNPHGSRGRPAVQELDKRAAEAVQKALEGCRDVQQAGLKGGAKEDMRQFHIGDFDSTGNLNSVRPDFTFEFTHGDFNCLYHLNTVDTKASGQPTLRETNAEGKLYQNSEKIVRNLAAALTRGMAHAGTVGKSGYAYDYLPKPKTNDISEINQIIEEFMLNVFSCSRITRECRRTSPGPK